MGSFSRRPIRDGPGSRLLLTSLVKSVASLEYLLTAGRRCCTQSVTERLLAALAPADRAMLAGIGAPSPSPDVPGVVLVPGSGPHIVDYAPAGAGAMP